MIRDYFKYTIINDQTKDNKVGIRIDAAQSLRDRILSYKLEFTATYDDGDRVMKDGKVAKLTKELWELSTCTGSSSVQCFGKHFFLQICQ